MDRPGAGSLFLFGAPLFLFSVFLGLKVTAGTEGLPQAIRLVLAAVAGAACLLLAGFSALAPRFGKTGPAGAALFAWFALFAVCLHDLFPGVASTRLVPALLFTVAAVLFDLPVAVALILTSAAALLSTRIDPGFPTEAVSNGGMAALAILLKLRVRSLSRPGGGPAAKGAEGDGAIRRLVNPWQGEGQGAEGIASAHAPGNRHDRVTELLQAGVHEILDAARSGSGADAVLFVTVTGDPSSLFRVGGHSLSPDLSDVPTLPADFPPLREALLFGQPHRAEEGEAGRWSVDVGQGRTHPLNRVVVLPVMGGAGNRPLGALCALGFDGGGWTDSSLYLMAASVQLLGLQMEVAREVDGMVRERRQQASLRSLVEGIARAAEPPTASGAQAVRIPDGSDHRQEVYRQVTMHLRDMIGASKVLLVEVEPGSRGARGRIAARWPEGEGHGDAADLESTYLARVFEKGEPRVVRRREGLGGGKVERRGAEVPVIPRAWGFDPRDEWIVVPAKVENVFEGLLVCASEHPPTKGEVQDAVHVVALLRMGMSHAVLVEKLHSRATTDGLTGLLNRRAYLERVQQELVRVDRRHPCSLVMLDVDHFKRVNDAYGHPAGDEVLRRISSVIGKTIRKSDYAGRYGGEEFSIFFHNMDKSASLQVVERIRVLVKEVKFDFGGKEVSVTVSLGLAIYPEHGGSADDLVRTADAALYRSKQGGRDRVTLSDGR